MFQIVGILVATTVDWFRYHIDNAGITCECTQERLGIWTILMILLTLLVGIVRSTIQGFAEVWMSWNLYLTMVGIWIILPLVGVSLYIFLVVPIRRLTGNI